MSDSTQEISISVDDGRHSVRVAGEATIYGVQDLKTRLGAGLADSRELHLDLSSITDIDTAGLQVFLLLWREAQALGRPLRVDAISAPVRDLLRLYGLEADLGLTAPEQGATT